MKNIVKVMRFNAEHARLYALPDGMDIKKGMLVTVEAPFANETAVGVAVTDSYTVDGDIERMVIELLHFVPRTLDNLKKVISVYDERPCMWPMPADDGDESDE